jgi:hypothetical protein
MPLPKAGAKVGNAGVAARTGAAIPSNNQDTPCASVMAKRHGRDSFPPSMAATIPATQRQAYQKQRAPVCTDALVALRRINAPISSA